MAEAAGWSVLPLSVSFDSIYSQLDKGLLAPAQKVSKQAGDSINKNLASGAEQAAKNVEKANYRVLKSTQELETAESKLSEQKLKTEAANKAVETAARKRAEAEGKGIEAVEKAEQDLLKKRAQAEKAARDLVSAESNVEKAMSESSKATKSLADRQKELDKAQEDTGKSGKNVVSRLKEMGTEAAGVGGEVGGLAGAFEGLAGKAGLIGGAIAGVASLGEIVSVGKEVAGSIGQMNREMGLTGDIAQVMGDEVGQVMRSGVVSSVEEATDVVGAMKAQFKDMPTDEIDALADNVSAFASTFEMDVTEATQIAGQMLVQGLAGDTEEAVDLMTASMQQVPKAMRGEIGDAITEYGVNFSNLGYTGEEAFAMLVNAADQGQYAIDKTGDAIKEFSVLAIDPAKAEAFESLGINAEQASAAVAEGGEGARKTLEETAQALLDMEDPGARAATAVELFGAPIEDLGVDQIPAFLEGLSGMGEGLGDVEGASQDLSDSISGSLQGRLNSLKGTAQDLAGAGFMAVWDATQWVVDGLKTLSGPAVEGISAAFGTIKDLAGGVTDILFRGDYTGLPFGLAEDSGVVDFLFNVRESVLDTRDTLTAAWDEITAAFTGGDWGYGALSDLIGEERALELVDMLSEYGDRLRDFWGKIQDAVTGAWDAIQPVFEWLSDFFTDQMSGVLESLGGALGSIAEAFGDVAGSVGGALWDALQGAWDLFKSLWDLLSPLLLPILKIIGGVVGGLVVGAFLGLVGAVRVAAEIIEVVAKVIQWLAEHVLSPLIGLIGDVARFFQEVLAGAFGVVGDVFESLVDGISAGWDWMVENVWDPFMAFFQDTLVPMWEQVWGGIQTAWDKFTDGIQWAWDNIFQPVFNGIWKVAQVTLGVIGTVILAPLMIAWNLLSEAIKWGWENFIKPSWDRLQAVASFMWENVLKPVFGWIQQGWELLVTGIQWAWENILKPAWDAVQSAASWLWENVLQPVFGFIRTGWETLVNGMKWAYENILQPAWNALQTAAEWMWNNVLLPVFGFIQDRWETLSNNVKWAYENIIQPAWDALQKALSWMYDNVIQPTFQWISDRWDDMANALEAGWRWIDENVFAALGRGLDTVKGWFDAAVDGIGTIWDGLRAAAAKPVRFVVDTVWNNGILAAWNAIAKFLPGIDEKDPVPLGELGNYATGGVLPGYTPGRDVHDFYSPTAGRLHLSGGEAIMRPEWVRAVGGEQMVHRMNAAARQGNSGAMMPTAAQTGYARDKFNIDPALANIHAHFADGGIWRSLWTAASVAFPNATNNSNYRPGDAGHHGYGEALDLGGPMQQIADWIFSTYPQSDQLIWGPGPLILQSGRTGYVPTSDQAAVRAAYGPGTMAGHYDHVHWASMKPIESDGKMISAAGMSSGGGFGSILADMARSAWDKAVSPITGWIGDKLGEWGDSDFTKIPGAVFESLKEAAWSKISSLFGSGGNSGSVDLSDISGPVVDQVEQVFAKHGFTGQQWEDAKWIIQRESNWDVNATNPSSGAFGLFQFNPMGGDTLGAYLPDRSTDPAVQGDAGARYIRDRYGDPTSARRFWEQNGWYDEGGVLPTGTTLVQNDTGQPEAILNPAQWRMFNRMVTNLPFLTESMEMVAKEIGGAFLGNDFGYGELARVLRNEEWARAIVSGSASLGTISREVGAAVAPVAAESGRGYLETQAASVLDVVGLGGLVTAGSSLWDQHGEEALARAHSTAQSLYGATQDPDTVASASFMGQRVTLEFNAESLDEVVRIGDLKAQADRIDGLEVELRKKKKVPAASVTRGGVM